MLVAVLVFNILVGILVAKELILMICNCRYEAGLNVDATNSLFRLSQVLAHLASIASVVHVSIFGLY